MFLAAFLFLRAWLCSAKIQGPSFMRNLIITLLLLAALPAFAQEPRAEEA